MQALLMAHAPTAVIVLLAVVYLQNQMHRQSQDLRKEISTLRIDLGERIAKVEADLGARIAQVEAKLGERIAQVEAKLDIPRSA